MNTSVQASGTVINSHVLSPEQTYGDEPKYRITLLPHDQSVFYQLEEQVCELKQEWEYTREPDPYEEEYGRSSRKDSVINGCEVLFESLHAPRLCKELKAMEWDHEMISKSVQVLGNLQIHKDGNCYISAHQVILTEGQTPPFLQEAGNTYLGMNDRAYLSSDYKES